MSTSITSASEIAIKAVGLKPAGTHLADEAGRCCLCGAWIEPGDLVDDAKMPPSFTNKASLAAPNSKVRCGACTALLGRDEFQMQWATALFSAAGAFPLMKKEHRAWAFLTPPEPPFVIAIQNSKQQHVVWRTPVSLSRDLYFVRVGDQVVRIRRDKLVKARAAALTLLDVRHATASASRGRPAATLESPFVNDWKFQSADGGTLKSWVTKLVREGHVLPEQLASLTALTAGEAWAIAAVLHPTPVRPDRLVA